jgi:hypothetical protein
MRLIKLSQRYNIPTSFITEMYELVFGVKLVDKPTTKVGNIELFENHLKQFSSPHF